MYSLFLRWVLIFLLCFASVFGYAQREADSSPYGLSLKRELVFGGIGALTIGTGTFLQNQLDEPLREDLRVSEYEQIIEFDRLGSTFNRGNSAKLSDYGLNTGVAIPALLLLSKNSRREFGKICILYVETVAITGGLTNMSKAGFARPRPYVYDAEWMPDRPLESGDRASFTSGHTSLSAAGCFFFARVYADYHPESRLRPYVWGVAATIPAVTGFLRIRAGRHFPTDVIAGYALGASVGYLVPMLHKKGVLPRGLRVSGGVSGIRLNYQF